MPQNGPYASRMETYRPPEWGSMAPSSARASAPQRTSAPEKSQMAITRPGSGIRRAMMAGTTKIPDPITAPTRSEVASSRPSLRGSSAAAGGACVWALMRASGTWNPWVAYGSAKQGAAAQAFRTSAACARVCRAQLCRAQSRGSSLELDRYHLQQPVAQVLLLVLDPRAPGAPAGVRLRICHSAIRSRDAQRLFGQRQRHPVRRMLVQNALFMRCVFHPEHAHLLIFEFQLVVFGRHLQRIERGRRPGRSRLAVELDFDDAESVAADVLAGVRAARRAPADLARLPALVLHLAGGGGGDVLAAGVEVNHHPVHCVFVDSALAVRRVRCGDHAHLAVVDLHVIRALRSQRRNSGGRQQQAARDCSHRFRSSFLFNL